MTTWRFTRARSARATRSRFARSTRARPEWRQPTSDSFASRLFKPGCAARSPGFLFSMPRWRNRQTRMPQKHEVPGSNPGWGTRFFARANALVLCSFTTRMWQRSPRRAARDACRPSMGRAAGWRGFPSSNGEDGGLSSRQCRFNSGRERHYFSRCSAAAGARRSGRRGRRFESCRRDQRFPCSSAAK